MNEEKKYCLFQIFLFYMNIWEKIISMYINIYHKKYDALKTFEAFQKKCTFLRSSNIPTYAKSWLLNLMSGIVACTYAVSFSPRKKV